MPVLQQVLVIPKYIQSLSLKNKCLSCRRFTSKSSSMFTFFNMKLWLVRIMILWLLRVFAGGTDLNSNTVCFLFSYIYLSAFRRGLMSITLSTLVITTAQGVNPVASRTPIALIIVNTINYVENGGK